MPNHGARRPALPAVSRGLAAQERRGLAAARKDWSAVPPPPRGGRWKLLREAKRGTRWRLHEVTRRSDIRCSRHRPGRGGLKFAASPAGPNGYVFGVGVETAFRCGVMKELPHNRAYSRAEQEHRLGPVSYGAWGQEQPLRRLPAQQETDHAPPCNISA